MNSIFVFSEHLGFGPQIMMVLVVTAVSCALIGNFLVLRKLSMVSDALSHSVLLGIVLAFFVTKTINSPFLILGAALFGLVTVFTIESLANTGLVKNDDAVGIVFPMFFSLAVILITKFARNVHIDTDVVLMGEAIMAPLNTITVLGVTLPKSLFYMSLMLIINLLFIIVFYKELKVTTFDMEFASIAGFSSVALFYALMGLVSFTSVVAFDAVGAILVVSFLVAPSASAYLITKDLKWMLVVSCLYGVVNSIGGYFIANKFNVSMSGMTATVAGITFFLTFLLNHDGFITSMLIKRRNRKSFRMELLITHLGTHRGTPQEADELGFETMRNHLQWKQEEIDKKMDILVQEGYVIRDEDAKVYRLTEKGISKYDKVKISYGM